MSTVFRKNRKASDDQILRANAVGLSLGAIGQKVGCDPTSVTLRLKALKIAPADTRRSFMQDIFDGLTPDYVDRVADILMSADPSRPIAIKDYMRSLLVQDVAAREAQKAQTVAQVIEHDALEPGDSVTHSELAAIEAPAETLVHA